MKLKIRRFDPSQIPTTATILLLGKRGSGKSTLMRDLMYHVRNKLSFGLAMSPTEESSASLGNFIPRSCIYNQFSGAALDVMLEIQRKSVKRGKWKNVYLIMDDCMYDKKVMKGVNIRELFMNGRHRKIFHMNAIQYMMDIGPDIRSQVDFVFALKENISSNREKLWKYFFGMFENLSDFNRVMNVCTAGYDAIVLDNTKRSNEVVDCVYWYRADPTRADFRVGDDIYWNLDKQYFRDRDDDDENNQTTMGVRDAIGDSGGGGGGGGGGGNTTQSKRGIHIIEKADASGHTMSMVSANNSYTGRKRW